MITANILWRRLDTPGHDACRLLQIDGGWRLDGTAVFRHKAVPAQLSYTLLCDSAWSKQQGRVGGWLGTHSVEFAIARTLSGAWTLNGVVVPGLENCDDLDLPFTPATNLIQLRRLGLAQGQAADAPVALLHLSGALELLHQRYERRTEATYWYEAPTVPYSALLEVTPSGFIRRYPGLWEEEA